MIRKVSNTHYDDRTVPLPDAGVGSVAQAWPKFGPCLQPATPVSTSFQRIVVALDDFGFFPLGDLVFRFVVAADASTAATRNRTAGIAEARFFQLFFGDERQRAQGRRLKARSLGPGR